MPNPYPCPTSPTEAVADARARVRSVSCLLDILHPPSGSATTMPAWVDRDDAWRETLLGLARCIAAVEHARDLESTAQHRPVLRRLATEMAQLATVPASADDAPVELGAVS